MSPIEEINPALSVALYLDFDGTLAPIVPHPQDARLLAGAREALMELSREPRFTIAIVSGRELSDLKSRVDIPGLVYAGNHGLEIQGRGLRFQSSAAVEGRGRLQAMVAGLRESLAAIQGAEVEDKDLTASVHYRRVDPASWSAVERIVETRAALDNTFLIRSGKMVWEIRPRVNWNKGSAVLWIREQLGLAGALEVYIGDDTTDEDAFTKLPGAVTIRVGPPAATAARYTFVDTHEVAAFLHRLTALKEAHSDSR